MRQLEFRAWHIAANEMIYPDRQSDVFRWKKDGQPIEIMQFTGLTDKNGVKIFEGDIVVIAGYGHYECVYPFTELYDAVMEGNIGIIIGNIHQNPELLER